MKDKEKGEVGGIRGMKSVSYECTPYRNREHAVLAFISFRLSMSTVTVILQVDSLSLNIGDATNGINITVQIPSLKQDANNQVATPNTSLKHAFGKVIKSRKVRRPTRTDGSRDHGFDISVVCHGSIAVIVRGAVLAGACCGVIV
jgi:hypothetical protein